MVALTVFAIIGTLAFLDFAFVGIEFDTVGNVVAATGEASSEVDTMFGANGAAFDIEVFIFMVFFVYLVVGETFETETTMSAI